MELWKIESNPFKQMSMSIACSAIGLLLVLLFSDFNGTGSNTFAGFLLGVLLLIIGIAGVLLNAKQTIIVDPRLRCITIEDASFFNKKKRSIRFGEVADISIGYLGRRSTHVTWYYLILKLRSGENYSLFSPGRFFQGGSYRSTAEGWRQRLNEYIGS
jgi:thiamine transporter ThiT